MGVFSSLNGESTNLCPWASHATGAGAGAGVSVLTAGVAVVRSGKGVAGVAGATAEAEGAGGFLLISRNRLGTPAAGGMPRKPFPPMLSSGFALPPT